MRISDWSSDVCSSDLVSVACAADSACPSTCPPNTYLVPMSRLWPRNRLSSSRSSESSSISSETTGCRGGDMAGRYTGRGDYTGPSKPVGRGYAPDTPRTLTHAAHVRSEEHTSELQSLMRHSYAVFCLKNKKN